MSDAQTRITTILTGDSSNFEAMCARAVVTLNQTQNKFLQVNKKINNNFSVFGSGLEKSLGHLGIAFGVGAVVAYGRQVLEVADQLKTLEDRTGVSGSTLRAYQADVENAGGSLEALGNSINKMQIKLGQAEGGSKTAAAAFASIGVKIAEIKNLTPDQQFTKVASAISSIRDPAQRAAAAFTIFGKGAAPLLPFLENFNKRAEETQGFVERLTQTMSGDTLSTLDDFGDSINTLTIRLTNLAATGLSNVINTIKSLKYQVAEVGILAGKSAGLIDSEIADNALAGVDKKTSEIFHPTANQPKSITGKGKFIDPDALNESAENAKKLTDALSKMQREANNDNAVSGLTPLQKKLADIDFKAKELAIQYKTKLTPEQQRYIDSTKEAVTELDKYERVVQLANDLGSAFSDAFGEAIDGAKSFSDVLGDLAKSIEKVLFKAVVQKPFEDLFSGLLKGGSSGGPGGILGSILGFGSYATGIDRVPYDMTARLHKGETVLTRQQSDKPAGAAELNVTVINNSPSSVSTKKSGSGDLIVMVDQAVAQNMSRAGSKTNQALRAQGSRALVRR